MASKSNGIWDFKSYDEKTWFRDLVCFISFLALLYCILHGIFGDGDYNYQYNKLNQDQSQFVTRICTGGQAQGKDGQVTLPVNTVKQVMDYVDHVFDDEIETKQHDDVKNFISGAKPQDAADYLSKKLFKIRSYFWLVGPAVYWEVIFCALFGVLCNLLFVLGAVGSNSTTDLANPETQFDSSEILGQVAKIIYAPICTLFVVLGYSLLTGQNIVDLNLGKGLLIFGFIGGYYSSRVISLMDRLKDVLLPNSGTAALGSNNQATLVQQVKIALSLDPSVPAPVAAVAAGAVLNTATVQITLSGTGTIIKGTHLSTDPDGTFTLTAVMAGNYTISASLPVTPSGASMPVTLSGTQTGSILSGIAPIQLIMK
ncbi:MAG: carboxypeptidase-like regulatory domain-containing protein [Sphingobacteriales bacterium]